MNYKAKLHIAITVFVMAFIFVQSALPGHISGYESGFFVSLLHDMTGVGFDVLSVIVRKAAHFTEYMILGICLAVNAADLREYAAGETPGVHAAVNRENLDRANESKSIGTRRLNGLPMWRAGALAWLAGTVYAVTDEIHQAFVPERACAATDVLIDSAGVAAGVVIASVFRWLRTRQ